MPPRRSARVAAAADDASCAFPTLPHTLAVRIFALLSVDERARAACVRRGWRATVADGSLWQRVDLSPAGGVAWKRVTDDFLLGLAARAAGHLQALDVSGCRYLNPQALVAAVTLLSTHALRELRAYDLCQLDDGNVSFISDALAAAPLLRVLEADVACFHGDAARVLRNEPPLQRLRVRELRVHFYDSADDDREFYTEEDVALVRAFGKTLASCAHASLTSLVLVHAAVCHAAAAEAVADAALALRLPTLHFEESDLSAAGVPGLARLLRGGYLTSLSFAGSGPLLQLDEEAAMQLADALRDCKTLTYLSFFEQNVFRLPAVLHALVAHTTLRALHLFNNRVPHDVEVGVAAAGGLALAALITADAPSLRELHCQSCNLGDAALGAVTDALATNTHLHKLNLEYAGMSAAFVRARLLPALRANTGLQSVSLAEYKALPSALVQECMDAVAAAR